MFCGGSTCSSLQAERWGCRGVTGRLGICEEELPGEGVVRGGLGSGVAGTRCGGVAGWANEEQGWLLRARLWLMWLVEVWGGSP